MGKFQSKIASKRRQSPEGGSLTSNVLTGQRELERIQIHESKLTENLYVELRENRSDHNCNRNVVLPLKTTPKTHKNISIQVNKQIKKKKGHAGMQDTECNIVPEEDSRQEWVFTLYNFDNTGKVTKEDMSSLIHSMYEVLEASVKQPGHTPLKIKLAVTPTACPDKISQIATEKGQSTPQKAGNPVRKMYCVDENIERRNHYLDLAGIENYTSKFDNIESPSQEPTQYTHSAVQHHTVVERGNCFSSDAPRGLSVLHSLKSKATSVRNDRCREEGKSYKHPASWCHLTPSHPPAHSLLQRSHSKRLRSRAQDAASQLKPTPGGDRDILSCGVRLVQRHEHHHHHEHLHHHHYHPA